MTSAAHEDYLRTIYLLLQRGERATNSAISSQLQVTPASATNMVKRLAALGLIAYTPYQSVELTPAGERMALEVVRYHRLLELYMTEALHMPWDQVHAEADRLEHAISEQLAAAMATALGNPTVDPHGDPIPGSDLSIQTGSAVRLADQVAGARLVLARVVAQQGHQLRLLGRMGLYPGARLVLREFEPGGDVLLEVEGSRFRLPRDLAEQLYVTPQEE